MLLALSIIGYVLLGIAIALAMVLIVRRYSPDSFPMKGTADIEGYYITVIGTLYAILIAFMIFVVWTRFYDAMETVNQEADAIWNLHRLAAALPEPYKSDIQKTSDDYVNTVVRYEWPAMSNSEDSPQTWAVVDRMWDIMSKIGPSQVPDEVLRDHLMEAWINVANLRRLRLLESRTALPGLLYAVLIFGAFLTVGFAAIFAVDKFWPHAIKACVLAALISFMLFTVYAIDMPFQGPVHVGSEAFTRMHMTISSE